MLTLVECILLLKIFGNTSLVPCSKPATITSLVVVSNSMLDICLQHQSGMQFDMLDKLFAKEIWDLGELRLQIKAEVR